MAGNYWEMPGGGKTPPNSTCEMRSNIQQISDFDFGQVRHLFWQNLAIVWMEQKNMVIYFFKKTSHQPFKLDYFERRRKFLTKPFGK